MAFVYLDTSALVKLFVEENGSTTVLALAQSQHAHTLAILDLTRVELHSALHRRERAGDIPAGTTQRSRDTLERHIRSRVKVQRLSDALLDRACTLLERHSLRAYDSLQLAGAIEVASENDGGSLLFVTADRTLLGAAAAEGLETLDPGAQRELQ